MCDITGHGVQAALVVATCRTVLSHFKLEQSSALNSPDFLAVLSSALNRILFRHGQGRHVATILGLSFDCEQKRLSYLTGGHPAPLLVFDDELGNPQLKPLLSRHSGLGVSEDSTYKVDSIELISGAAILAYTDGLPINSHIRNVKNALGAMTKREDVENIPEDIYKEVWRLEHIRTKKVTDDDVSIVWLKIDI